MTRLIALLAFLGLTGPVLAEDLTKYTGEWNGKGWVQSTKDTQEALRCRLKAALRSDVQIDFTGTCATPAASGQLLLALAFGSDGKALAARLKGVGSQEQIDLKGQWDSRVANLRGRSTKGETFRMRMVFAENNVFLLEVFSGEGSNEFQRLKGSFRR